MFMFLYVFSSIFSISATAGEDTSNMSAPSTALYILAITSVASFPIAPTTFGVFFVLYTKLPGSTLSGENPK